MTPQDVLAALDTHQLPKNQPVQPLPDKVLAECLCLIHGTRLDNYYVYDDVFRVESTNVGGHEEVYSYFRDGAPDVGDNAAAALLDEIIPDATAYVYHDENGMTSIRLDKPPGDRLVAAKERTLPRAILVALLLYRGVRPEGWSKTPPSQD